MGDAPERIWLQFEITEMGETGETTWCEDKINNRDTEYVRADLYAEVRTDMQALCDLLAIVGQGYMPSHRERVRLSRYVRQLAEADGIGLGDRGGDDG